MSSRFKNWEKPKIIEGKLTKWNWMVQGVKNLDLGKNVDIGAFTYINAQNGVEIHDFVQIGGHCAIHTKNTIDEIYGKIIIKEKARIGAHSTIMPNVTIGKNALIGAYSFVNKDIPDNSIAYGVPVKIIKKLK